MENNKTEYYFSEKLLDVILTGAVPIYWGCKSIGNYFNTEGMLLFDNKEELFELLLRRNYDLVGAQFGIGPEHAIFLTGELPFHAVDEDELDRILGTIWEYVERYWRAALKMGFASQLKDKPEKKAE